MPDPAYPQKRRNFHLYGLAVTVTRAYLRLMFTPTPAQVASVGATLRAMRQGVDLSLNDLAARASTTKTTLSLFENGRRTISADLLARIARVIADEAVSKRSAS